jgi:hypothetical protein
MLHGMTHGHGIRLRSAVDQEVDVAGLAAIGLGSAGLPFQISC